MEMLTNYFGAAAIDLLNINVVACAILFVVALALGISIAAVRCKVVYLDSEDGSVIHKEKHGWLSSAYVHTAKKTGKKFVGWSTSKSASKLLHKNHITVVKNVKLFAIWEDAEVVETVTVERKGTPKELDYADGMFVQFNFIDAEANTVATQGFKINGKLPEEDNEQIVVDGWSFEPNGEIVVSKGDADAVFTIDLYPVFGENDLDGEFEGEAVIEIAYVDSKTNARVYKESHYVTLDIPAELASNSKLVGFAVEKDGEVVVERGDNNSVFTLELCSVGGEVVEETTTEVVEKSNTTVVVDEVETEEVVTEEVVTEEVVTEEVVTEEVVTEEVVTEEVVTEEVVTEETVVEPVYDYVFEEIVEEPIVEEVTEEVVVEEKVYTEEETVEEVVTEEVVTEEVVTEEVVTEEVVTEEVVTEEVVTEEVVTEEVVTEEVVTEEVVTEEVVTEEVVTEESTHTPVIVPTYYDNEGNKIDIKYSRSFTANVIQSKDEVKSFYNEIKNHILSYKGVKSRISWKFDSYNKGRDQLFKMKLRGKTICLYCKLNPDEFDKAKYHHEAIDAKIFEDVPMLVKIKSGLGLRKAKELVDIEMAQLGIVKDPKAKTVDYVAKYPYEETDALLARGLVKALVSDADVVVMSTKVKDEVVEEPIVEVVEEPIVEVVEEVVTEEVVTEEVVTEETTEEVVIEEKVYTEEETVEEVVTEEVVTEEVVTEEVVTEEVVTEEVVTEEVVTEEVVTEEVVTEEVVTEEVVTEEVVTEEVVTEEHVYVESVTAEEAHLLAEVNHIEVVVEEDVEYISKGDNKKCIVNIDTLSKEFEAGDVVDIASLKAKKLVDKKAKSVKVLARGCLDKPLTVKAGEFSNTALEMITLTGGHAIHVTYKVK